MKKRGVPLILLAGLMALLAGCFSRSADELYTPPKPAGDYQQLDAKIKEVLAAGAEYAAPIQGSYTQQVQLMDLDGDGVQEAIAFFRFPQPSENELPLNIYIYRQDEAGDYQLFTTIQGDGTGINSISYVDLDGEADRELVVSWRISGQVYQLMAYDLQNGEAQELMRAGGYTQYAIRDLDMDNRQEIVTITDKTDDGTFRADFYDFDSGEGNMVLRSSAPLSAGLENIAESVDSSRTYYLRDHVPALFITSNVSGMPGVITDILAWREGTLTNITLNPETGQSDVTFRLNSNVSARDIDGDGVLELPQPNALPDADRLAGADDWFWSVRWVQYDLEGQGWPVLNTYYNRDDSWYLILPDAWEGKIALSRADRAVSGERAVVFYHWNGTDGAPPERFLTVYKLTGPNRTALSRIEGRFILRTEADTIYAAQFDDDAWWDCGLDQETLSDAFRLIRPEWNLS